MCSCVPQVVYVGERAVDHNPALKLYLVTRNAAPALTPDVVPLLTVTNFSITRSGLESECHVQCVPRPPLIADAAASARPDTQGTRHCLTQDHSLDFCRSTAEPGDTARAA